MPTRVVAVHRSPSRVFELLRSAPAWLRAVFVSARAPRDPERDALRLRFASDASDASLGGASPGESLLAFESGSGVAVPAWVGGGGAEPCADCEACVAVCPSKALELREPTPFESARDDGERSLFLLPGNCIGCGDCVRACPANRLRMRIDPDRVGEDGAPAPIDLIAQSRPQVEAAPS